MLWSALAVGIVFLAFEAILILRPGISNWTLAIILILPGAVVSATISILAGQGIHGSALPNWLVDTISWLFYTLLTFVCVRVGLRLRRGI